MAKCISGELTGNLGKLAEDFGEFSGQLEEINFPTAKLSAFTSSLSSLDNVLGTVKTSTDDAVKSLKDLARVLGSLVSVSGRGSLGGTTSADGIPVRSKNALTNDTDRYYREFKSNIIEGSLNKQTDETIKGFLTDPNIAPATRNNWVGAISKLGANAPSLLNLVGEQAQGISSPTNKAILFREIAKANFKTGQELLDPTSGIYQSVMGNVGKMGSDPSNANKYLEEIANAISGKNAENPSMTRGAMMLGLGAGLASSIVAGSAQTFSNFITNRPQNALQQGQAIENSYSTWGGLAAAAITAGSILLAAPTGGLSLSGLALAGTATAAAGVAGSAVGGYAGRLGSQDALMAAMYHGRAGADPFGGNTGILPEDVYAQYQAMGMTLDTKDRREFMRMMNSAEGMNLSRTKVGAFGDYGMSAVDEATATLSLGRLNRVGANLTARSLATLTDSSGLGLTLGQVDSTANLLSNTSRFRTGDSEAMIEQYARYAKIPGASEAFLAQESATYTGKITGNALSQAFFGKGVEGVLDDLSSGDASKRSAIMDSLKRATGASTDMEAIDIARDAGGSNPQIAQILQSMGGKAGKDPTELLASMEGYMKELVDLMKKSEAKEPNETSGVQRMIDTRAAMYTRSN